MKEKLTFGVDFGTSNSSIGAVRDGNLEVFNLENGNKSQPSSIFIRADGYHSVGFQALKDFHTPEAKTDTYHFIPSVKPGLPLEKYEGNLLVSKNRDISGQFIRKYYPVTDLASFIISDLKKKAEAQTGQQVHQAVLGRPVVFSEDKKLDQMAQQRLEEAAHIAGFENVFFVLEPVAAALHYEKNYSKPGERRVFVFDFGGGTLDTCVLEIGENAKTATSPDELNSKVLSSHGITLGGTDLDKDIFRGFFLNYFGSGISWGEKNYPMPAHIHADITEWHLLQYLDQRDLFDFLGRVASDKNTTDKEAVARLITLIAEQQVFALLQNVEAAKIELSESDLGKIIHNFDNIDIDLPITRAQFEATIYSRKKQIQSCVDETLKKANLKPEEIDVVIRVGGSSNNPFTEALLLDTFNRVEKTDAFTSVVAGLSLAADQIYR